MAKPKISAPAVQRSGPLAQLTVGVDGIVELRELSEQNPPPLYAPGSPALSLFHKCLLVAMQSFDKALAKAYKTVQDRTAVQIGAAEFTPTTSAFEAVDQKFKVRRAKN
jgi:hypothetical protein